MSALTLPNPSFTANTLIQSAQVNANNTAITNWSTTIDHSNTVGSTGFYASDIKPLTAAEATFGLTATGVGFTFLGNDSTAVPLTVSAVSGQTADIFDVTLTSGGTKSFFVLAGGAVNVGSSGQASTAGDLGVARDTTGGLITLGGASSFGTFDFGVGTGGSFRLVGASSAAGNLILSSNGQLSAGIVNLNNNPNPTTAGDLGIGRGVATCYVFMGTSATTAGRFDFGGQTAGTYSLMLNPSASSYAPVNGGVYTNASDAKFKSNVAPITYGLPAIMALKPASFTVINTKAPGLGFIAQDVQGVLPELVSADGSGSLGVNYDGIIPVLVKALQEMTATLKAAGVAGF